MTTCILTGDCREVLKTLPDESVHCCVCSPPYWGLRSYGIGTENGELGIEPTPAEYVANMVEVFREVKRVMRHDATLWLNLGDAYQSKQLLGMPWRIAFALQADGWYLRQDIIWSKPNPMPESVTDRCTKAHEYIFLLSKSERYFYDVDAIKEPAAEPDRQRNDQIGGANGHLVRHSPGAMIGGSITRNKRSVWTVATQPYSEAHFATFPPALIEPCILAGCPKDGTVLDPFGGAGTTGLVADRLGRNAILIELNPEYTAMIERRIKNDAGMFANLATQSAS